MFPMLVLALLKLYIKLNCVWSATSMILFFWTFFLYFLCLLYLLFRCILDKMTTCWAPPLSAWSVHFTHLYEPVREPTTSLHVKCDFSFCKQKFKWCWYLKTIRLQCPHIEMPYEIAWQRELYDAEMCELCVFSTCLVVLTFRKSLMGPQYLLHSDLLQRKVCSMMMSQSTRTDWASQRTTRCLSPMQRSVTKRDLCAC